MTWYYDENTYIKFGVFATLEETPRLMLNVVEKIGDEVITHEGVCVDNSNKDIYLKMIKTIIKLLRWIMYIICVMKEFVRVSVLQVQCLECMLTLEIMEAGILTAREDTEQMIIMRHLIISDIKHKIMSTKVLILKVSCETL